MKKVYLILFVLCFAVGEAQIITTVAGNGTTTYSGDGGQATAAGVYAPSGAVEDKNGNLFVVQNGSNVVRKVDISGMITTWAGTGVAGFAGDGGPAGLAQLNNIRGIAIDTGGNIYIVDSQNYRIRKVNKSGIISTVAGNGTAAYLGDNGPATAASFDWSQSVTVGLDQSLYIADEINNVVRKVDINGIITTYSGNGGSGATGDGGPATQAQIGAPSSLFIDKNNNLYISGANVIRRVNSSGIITTYAGSGITGFSGDGGPAISAQFDSPDKIAFDNSGNLFISDRFNNRIRMVDTSGIINTIAGNGINGYAGDGGPPLSAEFNNIQGLYIGSNNELFLSDFDNHRVRKITPSVGIKTFPNDLHSVICPNPANNTINILSSKNIDEIKIMDVLGAEVKSQKFEVKNETAAADISSLQNGIYFLKIISGKENTTRKLVVSH